MADYNETVGSIVAAQIIPSSPLDTYPTHIANYGRGGYKTVSSMEERDAIPEERLTIGCEVRVTTSEGSVVYYLESFNTSAPHNWKEVKSGLNDEDLSAYKGLPGGLAELDADGKVPVNQSRSIIFRGSYINETTFNSNSGVAHAKMENAIYIDKSGKMYSWSEEQLKFIRDTMYWQEIV